MKYLSHQSFLTGRTSRAGSHNRQERRWALRGIGCHLTKPGWRAAYRQFAYCPLVGALWLTMMLTGCAEQKPSSGIPVALEEANQIEWQPSESALREVSRDELQQLVQSSDRPVLVEFSVLSGCYRCNDMQSPIRQKVTELQQHADVVRIDFNLNQTLAREVGAAVCPSYVVYSKGRVTSVRTWPTSADFVADDVRQAIIQPR